jgi:hypothetical protein
MRYLFLMVLATVLVCGGCGDDRRSGGSDSDTDTDTDSDSDTDTDTDTDSDTDCTLGAYSGGFMINSQSDVATLAGYTLIFGDLYIECPSCTDLSELICLTSTGGDLSIRDNAALINLDGLSALYSVGGWVWIEDNALSNLDGLSALISVGGESLAGGLVINSNPALPDCEVCDLLDQITYGPTSTNVEDNLDDACTPVPTNCP